MGMKHGLFLSHTLRQEHRLKVFENRLLRRICEPKTDEVTEEWRRLHNEELHDLSCSPNIIRVIKLRTMRWVGNVARMGNRRHVYRVMVERPETMKQLDVDQRIILKWIWMKIS